MPSSVRRPAPSRRARWWFVLFLLSCGAWPVVAAPAQTDLVAQLQAAADQSGLGAPGLKPWHLKLTYSAPSGAPDTGTVEQWWAAPDRWRQEWTSNGQKHTTVRTPEGLFQSSEGGTASAAAQMLFQQVVQPVEPEDLAGAVAVGKDVNFGAATLQCIMLVQPVPGGREIPFGLFPTYCLQGDKLRVAEPTTNTSVVTQKMGVFQGRNVAMQVEVSSSGAIQSQGEVEQLATYTPEDSQFDVAGLVKGSPGRIRISGGVIMKNRLSGPPPVYPASARQKGVSGTVVMEAGIGTDGRVHRLRVVSSGDPDLSLAALEAVQQWVYRPYVLNGVPVAVTTTVTTNFKAR